MTWNRTASTGHDALSSVRALPAGITAMFRQVEGYDTKKNENEDCIRSFTPYLLPLVLSRRVSDVGN